MFEFVDKDGSVVFYSDHGSGIPILFLHGWLMSRRVWFFQNSLSEQFRVITLDLRGHGDSRESDFSYNGCIRDIARLLDHLRIDRAVLAGWSMGAQIAIRLYGAMSWRVSGMILVGGTPSFCKRRDYSYGVPPSEVRMMAQRLNRDYRATAGEFFKSMFTEGEMSSSQLAGMIGKILGRIPDSLVALSALKELADSDLRVQLQGVSVPVLLVRGEEDKICLPEASGFMSEMIPEARLELFEKTGHAPFLSHQDEFNSLLTGFVKAL